MCLIIVLTSKENLLRHEDGIGEFYYHSLKISLSFEESF